MPHTRIITTLPGVFLILFCIFASAANAQPSINFAQTEFDFGDVASQDEVVHTFELSNKGTDELVIEKTISS